MLAPHVTNLSLTTNGSCSSATPRRSVAAGINPLQRLADSLQRDRFFDMTRRDALPRVLRASNIWRLSPAPTRSKVNAVAMRGFTGTRSARSRASPASNLLEVRSASSHCRSTPTPCRPKRVAPGEDPRRDPRLSLRA